MLKGIQAQRAREGRTLDPYALLDLDDPVDRRIVNSVYNLMAREAMPDLEVLAGPRG